jgi:hypothetical protein
MQFSDFEEQIFSIDRAIHREISERPSTRQARAPKDLTELRPILRRAAEDLILCTDVDEGIKRLREDLEALSAVLALTVEAPLSRDDHRLAGRRAFEATRGQPSALPFYPFCSYLIELCDALELAESNDGKVH